MRAETPASRSGAAAPASMAPAHADELGEEACGDEVTFVKPRNVNSTHVRSVRCRVRGFSKGPACADPGGARR